MLFRSTWLEGGTPVTGYGDVTAAALSIYAERTNDARVLKALERHFDYVCETLYPNFSRNDCVDGRYWYTLTPFPYTAPSYLRFNRGKEYLERWIERIGSIPQIGHYTGLSLQGLTALTGVLDAFPEIEPPPSVPLSTAFEGETEWPEITTRITRKDGWIITQSAPLSSLKSRWIFERQNLTSVFHHRLGLIIGGGHSVAMPEWSSFNIIGEGMVHYVPSEAELIENGLRVRYGDVWGTIRHEIVSAREILLSYQVETIEEWQRALVRLPLWLPSNTRPDPVRIDSATHVLNVASTLSVPENEPLIWRGYEIILSAESTFRYPVDGYTPYVKNGSARTQLRRQALIEVPLNHSTRTLTVRLRMTEEA